MASNLKYFLLLLLILILVYILYQKLLKSLGKRNISKNFVKEVQCDILDGSNNVGLSFELSSPHRLDFDLLDKDRNMLASKGLDLDSGAHSVQIDNKKNVSPKWIIIRTPFEVLERRISSNN